jgi:hypothetical protein
MAREKAIKVRLNAQEFEFLETEAARRDIPMSQIIRESLKQEMKKRQLESADVV